MPQTEIEKLKEEIERLKAAKNKVTMKVSTKTGALSVYHGSRFPTTLYASQWRKILTHADEIMKYLDSHDAELSHKEGE